MLDFRCYSTDRKKDLVKLQVGEYVSLAKVETLLKLCPLVDNLCLYADSSKMYTVCLVVPNQKNVLALAKKLGATPSEWPFICESPEIENAVLRALQEQGLRGRYFWQFFSFSSLHVVLCWSTIFFILTLIYAFIYYCHEFCMVFGDIGT